MSIVIFTLMQHNV